MKYIYNHYDYMKKNAITQFPMEIYQLYYSCTKHRYSTKLEMKQKKRTTVAVIVSEATWKIKNIHSIIL
ncbi:hypothetical protein CHS0354_032143 [Potamilus streckersoni]|uniref:Uncharacterized protein n=1 Tax=Potamilus streckersoni TaxID=2493646 RepID=A0AAE0TI54_9BIVA|nr:hypothetical protein CHS0354_032143 [Potamilus streckersoni]